jgi:hypothetical protein
LWIGADVLAAALYRLFALAGVSRMVAGEVNIGAHVVFGFVAMAQCGFQAWLLCRSKWWIAGWVACGLFLYASFYFVLRVVMLYPYWVLLVPGANWLILFIRSIMLIGVRQRPWAWLFVGFGVMGLKNAGSNLLTWPPVSHLMEQVAASLPIIKIGDMKTAAMSGLWLLGGILYAVALAWWMPPVATAVDEPREVAATTEG